MKEKLIILIYLYMKFMRTWLGKLETLRGEGKQRKMFFGAKSKKGNAVAEGLTILIFITVFGLASIIAYMAFDQLNSDIMSDADFNADAAAVSNDLYGKYACLFDNLFLFIWSLFVMFAFVSAWMIDSKPILFGLSIILLVGLFVATPLIANVFDDVVSDVALAQYANAFTYTSWIMRHLLELFVGIAFMISLVVYMKFK